jgi:type I restriction enzyme S subunit
VEYKELGEVAMYSDTRVSAASVNSATFVGVGNLLANQAGRTTSTYVPTTGNLTEYRQPIVSYPILRRYYQLLKAGKQNLLSCFFAALMMKFCHPSR